MRNILNKIYILVLSCLLIMCATIKSSHAFGPYPPMPFDIVLDIPANAGKVVSILQETKRYVDSANRYRKSLNIKKVVGKIRLFAEDKLKDLGFTPGILDNIPGGISGGGASGGGSISVQETGPILAKNSDLGIGENPTEEELQTAFYKLFLIYPVESEQYKDNTGEPVKLPVLQTIHKQNNVNYRQDIAMSTYLYAQKKELFLDVIERTIDRLDACQKAMGAAEKTKIDKPDDCTFFGMAMVEVPTQEEIDEKEGGEGGAEGEGGEEAPAGQSEEMQNAYIVSMVYDRLLKIVEELTAVEAEFRASQQIELVVPANQGEAQSDASDYINNTFKFAYSNHIDYSNAKIRDFIQIPDIPEILTKKKNVKGTFKKTSEAKPAPDAGKLQGLENILNNAIQVHNLKSQLPDYKIQYRQYLMAKKIHERAFNTLIDGEKCIIDFIDEHNSDLNAIEQWRGLTANPFKDIKSGVDHDSRADNSISKTLIKKYQEKAQKTILNTSDDEKCKNYRIEGDLCPSGYILDVKDASACKSEEGEDILDSTGKKLYPCVVKTVTPDIPESNITDDFTNQGEAGTTIDLLEVDPNDPDAEENKKDNEQALAMAGISDPNAEGEFNENEFMSDSDQSEQLENDTRKKNEFSWRIGADMMMELTQSGKLSFDPWVDQHYLQKEYLRNKYRNLRLIVKSMDQGKISYQIAAQTPVTAMDLPADLLQDLKDISTYVPLEEVATKFRAEVCKNGIWCSGCGFTPCGTVLNKEDGSVTLHAFKYKTVNVRNAEGELVYNEDGSVKTEQVKEKITRTIFSRVKGTQYYKNDEKGTDELTSMFTDFPNTIKEAYLAYLAEKDSPDLEAFYKKAQNEGREVARDLLEKVLDARNTANEQLENFLKGYYNDKEPLGSITKKELLIKKQKESLSSLVKKQDLAQEAKNKALDEEKRTKERLVDIDNQIKIKQEKRAKLVVERDNATNRVVKALNEKAIEGIDKLIKSLEKEKEYLQNSETECTKDCPTTEYLPQKVIEVNKNKAIQELDVTKEQTKVLKASIAERQTELEDLVEEFSDKYIVEAQNAHNLIEYSNQDYENFVEPLDDTAKRMRNSKEKDCKEYVIAKWTGFCMPGKLVAVTYDKDNLEETIKQFYNSGSTLESHVRKFVEEQINKLDIKSKISSIIADEFYLGGTLGETLAGAGLNSIGLKTGVADTVVSVIKEKVIEHTVNEIVNTITTTDTNVQKEMERATKLINDVAQKLGVSSESDGTGEIDIMYGANYGYTVDNNGNRTPNKITNLHKDMFTELETEWLLGDAVNINDVYSIPVLSEDEKVQHQHNVGNHPLVDDEYFVGLPARGVIEDDEDSGRDYTAPKGPMMNLPPLREVFYYSPLDYDDVPKEGYKKGKKKKERFSPSISHLLKYKYDTYGEENWEYIPEVWRYMLAIPSLREDGKFQQTFIERAMEDNMLNNHIGNNDTSGYNNAYAQIIARAGVYPCKLGSRIIDVKATMDIKEKQKTADVLKGYDMEYIYTTPKDGDQYPQCKEVQLSGSNKIKHLLADEDKNTSSLKRKDIAKISKMSELGQFLDVDRKYRWFLQEIYKFLTDTTKKKRNKTPPNQINNVWRQLHDLSAYKRNLFGSFLDSVTAEKDAKTNLDNAEYQLKEVLAQLCEQVHELGVMVGDTSKTFEEITNKCKDCEDCDDICSESALSTQKTQICVNYIFDKGLAKNIDDKSYGSSEYKTEYNGIKKSDEVIYSEIYFMLDEVKDNLLTTEQEFPSDPKEPDKKVSMKYKDVMEELKSDYYDKKEKKWDTRIEDRMLAIETMHTSLTTDKDEIAYITPDDKVDVEKAKKNKEQSFKSGEEGLKGMDNQSKIVPYCPSY